MGCLEDGGGKAPLREAREVTRGGEGGGLGAVYVQMVSGEGVGAGGGADEEAAVDVEDGAGAGWKKGVVVSVRQRPSCVGQEDEKEQKITGIYFEDILRAVHHLPQPRGISLQVLGRAQRK